MGTSHVEGPQELDPGSQGALEILWAAGSESGQLFFIFQLQNQSLCQKASDGGARVPLMELSLIPVPRGDPSSRQKAQGRNDASSAGTTHLHRPLQEGPLSGTCWRLGAGAEDGLELVQLLSRESPAIDAACHIPPLPE